jgi:hypothetical protein
MIQYFSAILFKVIFAAEMVLVSVFGPNIGLDRDVSEVLRNIVTLTPAPSPR